MAWARVDDGWWCHPKVLGLDLDARGLWVSTLSWSCQQKTDRIPAAVVAMCRGDDTIAGKLVDAGLWDDLGDGNYAVHDWEEYQSDRAKKAAAGREGGKKSGETRAKRSTDSASAEPKTSASREAGPSRPGPTQPNPSKTKSGARKRATPLPKSWEPKDDHHRLATENGTTVAAEVVQFADFHRAKGSTFKDWDAAFRTWIRNTRKFGTNGKSPPSGALPVREYDPEDSEARFRALTGGQ